MSFQTVKCPKCGKAHIEFPDPKLRVVCSSCKRAFKPFLHLKETQEKSPEKNNAPSNQPPIIKKVRQETEQSDCRFKPEPAVSAASDQPASTKIFEHIITVNKAVQKLKNGLEWTQVGEVVLQEIKVQMTLLGKTLFERLSISPATFKEDLKPTFTFTPLSNYPQSLGLILAYFYVKMDELGREACIQLIGDSEHWLLSLDVIDFYKPGLQKLNIKI